MQVGSRLVCSPDGKEWHIGRRWTARDLPRWRPLPAGQAAVEAITDSTGLDDLATTLAIALGVIVVAVVIIPLLLFGIELIILGCVIAAGITGSGLLGRPWIVEATVVGASTPTYTWKVRGWRRSVRLIDEATASLSTGIHPPQGL